MRSFPSGSDEAGLSPADERRFGLGEGDDRWLDHAFAAAAEARLGTLGDWELLGEVSRGGQGVVYRARQPRTGRDVALKVLREGSFASAADRRRFEREVELASSLDHPGVVTVYGFEEVDGLPVLSMEWIAGVPATQWARTPRPDGSRRSARELLDTFAAACDAVSAAHQRGVLHRDLKPSNVLVGADGRPRVLDFGLAKSVEDSETLTRSGGFVGTPGYASPEQLEGRRVDVRSDVFSLGVLLHEMLTGRLPFEADEGLVARLRAIEEGRGARPSTLRGDVPPDVDSICRQALAADPDRRYASAAALADDVRRALSDRPVLAHPPSAWYELAKLVHRHRAASALALSLVLLLAAFAFVSSRQAAALAEKGREEAGARADAELAEARAVDEARRAAEAERRALDEAREAAAAEARAVEEARLARLAEDRATEAARRAEATVQFLVDDVIETIAEDSSWTGATVHDLLSTAAERAPDRFAGDPALAAEILAHIARAQYFLGRSEEAEASARGALALADGVGEEEADAARRTRIRAALVLGLALMEERREEEAVPWLEESVRELETEVEAERANTDDLAIARTALVLALGRGGRHDAAAEVAWTADALEGEGAEPSLALVARLQRVQSLSAEGEHATAVAEGREALGLVARTFGPESELMSIALIAVGEAEERAGETEPARESLREALRILHLRFGEWDARIPRALARLGATFREPHEREEGETCFRQAIGVAEKVHGVHHELTADLRARHGAWLAQHGDWEAAVDPLFAAVTDVGARFATRSPRTRAVRENLALALVRAGRPEEGLFQLSQLFADQEAEGVAAGAEQLELRSEALRDLGRASEAWEAFDASVELRLADASEADRAEVLAEAIRRYESEAEAGEPLAAERAREWRARAEPR